MDELQILFVDEAAEIVSGLEQAFLAWDANRSDSQIADQIFRLAHNLKGSSRAVGLMDVGSFTHDLESLMLKVKTGETPLSDPIFDLLLKCNDELAGMIQNLRQGVVRPAEAGIAEDLKRALRGEYAAVNAVGAGPGSEAAVDAFDDGLSGLGFDDVTAAAIPDQNSALFDDGLGDLAAPSPADSSTEGVADDGLGDLLSAVSSAVSPLIPEKLMPPPASPAAASTPPVTSVTSKDLPKDSAPNTPPAGNSARGLADEGIRVSLQRVDRLVNMIGELVILQTVLSQQRHLVPSPLLQKTIVQLGKITKEIQDTSMGLRLVPFKPICQKLQRIVRDTSKELGKDIEFVIIGEDIEIDKTVADQLGDPLVHMVRNACDHGLEATSDRVAAGKVPRGKIVLKAGYEGDKIVIELSDDGRGLDAQRLRAKAQEKGLIKPGQSLTEAECHALIFAAGFSTKAAVTDLSGRGVGMDVVKTNVEKVLKGTVGLETKIGSGTKFRIMLPMSLAIIDAMVVRCAGERFVIPLGQVFESVRPTAKDLHKVVGVGDVMKLRGENLPLIHLGRQLGVKSDAPGADAVAVVTRDGQRATAFLVDEIIARQQVVIKKLGREVPQHRGVTGGAVLGDGVAALIVDLNELSGAKSHQKGAAA